MQQELFRLLGWEEELNKLWAETASSVAVLSKKEVEIAAKDVEVREDALKEAKKAEKQANVNLLEDFVGRLAEKIKDVSLDEKEDGSPKPDEAESKVAEEKSNPEKPVLVNADNAQTS